MTQHRPAPESSAAPTGSPRKRFRVQHLLDRKSAGQKITMLTAYDSITGRIFDAAGVDILLVGDSVGDNVLGHENTIPVTLDEMVLVGRSVARAAKHSMVLVDLPFGSYEASPTQALASAVRILKETGAQAVKFEGGARLAEHVALLTASGIPVFGHLGFTPQSEHMLGGKRVQGRGDDAAERLCSDALVLQEAGAVAIVLEMIPAPVAARATEILHIPTIGIGAGTEVDGQVLVWTDMAGMGDWSPRFAKQFGQVGAALSAAASAYVTEVVGGTFPGPEHQYER